MFSAHHWLIVGIVLIVGIALAPAVGKWLKSRTQAKTPEQK